MHQDPDSRSVSDESSKENHADSTNVSPLQPSETGALAAASGRPGRRGDRRRPVLEFAGSVYVGALPRRTRVSKFKAQVRQRNVNPVRVLWRGRVGFAFLNFHTLEEAEIALEALKGLQVSLAVLT